MQGSRAIQKSDDVLELLHRSRAAISSATATREGSRDAPTSILKGLGLAGRDSRSRRASVSPGARRGGSRSQASHLPLSLPWLDL